MILPLLLLLISNLCYAEDWSGTHAGITKSNDGDFIEINLKGDVTLTSPIVAGYGASNASSPRNAKIIIQNGTNGPVTIKKGDGLNTFLQVWEGATIHVKGSSGKEITFDALGGTGYEMIASTGNLILEHVKIINHTNTNLDGGNSTPYCAIKLACFNNVARTMGTTTIDNCLFKNIHCQVGSVLYAPSYTKDHASNNRTNTKITISNTVIENCSATRHDGGTESDQKTPTDAGGGWGGIIRTKGGWVGDMELNNVTIQDCSAEFSCAGVFWNACGQAGTANRQPYLTIKGCKFLRNKAKISGGAIRIEGFCKFELGANNSPTVIAYNSAGVMGGGIHIYGYAGGNMGAYDFKYDLKALDIHDNTAQYGGGIGIQITPKCTLDAGTSFNINFDGAKVNGNKATVKGGGIYYENIADAAKNYTINLFLNKGEINGNIVAPTPDNFEFGKTVAKLSAFYDTADKEDEYKSCGGAVYLNKANIQYEKSKAGEMTMNSNKASVYGGAVFVTGKLASLNLQSLSASKNEAQRGAAIACISIAEPASTVNPETYATRVTLGDATLSGNIATEDGGGAYLVRGKLTVENNAVFSGNKAGHGGAIHTKQKSILTIGNATFENNEASANGGAIYIENGCNINITSGAVFRGNKMTRTDNGGGGAICAKNDWTVKANFDFVTANIKNAVFENNYSGYRGGAIELDGVDQSENVDFTLENATFTGNEAKIGGAILVNEAKLTYKGGLIYGNRAVITPGSNLPKTSYGYFPYNWKANCYYNGQFSGFGGGIAISKDGQFIIENTHPFGIYGNTAEIAGNDISTICSDKSQYNGGSNMDKDADNQTDKFKYFPKTLIIPQPEELNLSGFKIPLPKSAVKWMEDYNAEDGAYHLGTKLQDVKEHKRYGELLNNAEGIKKLSGLIVNGDKMNSTKYLHLTLGYNFIFVKLVKKGLKAGDTSIFNISYKEGSNYVKYMTVSLTNTSATDGAETSRIIALSEGDWKIEETDWAWDYDRPAAQEFSLNVNSDATNMKIFTFENKAITKPAPNGEGYKINDGMKK